MLINKTFYQEITCPQWGSNQIKKARRSTTLFPVIVATILSVQILHDNDICYRAYERHLDCSEHEIGKRNTQKIERKNLNFRHRSNDWYEKNLLFQKMKPCSIPLSDK